MRIFPSQYFPLARIYINFVQLALWTYGGMEAGEAQMANAYLLRVKRLSDQAFLPSRGSAHAAGYDLYRCVVC